MHSSNSTPEGAIEELIEAYRSLDINRIVAVKDFDLDSRIHWQLLGIPISEDQLQRSAKAFEENFRNKLKSGIPDLRAIDFTIADKELGEDGFAVVTLKATDKQKQTFTSQLAVYDTGKGWKVALHPDYAHF